jgi:hypothetical protein
MVVSCVAIAVWDVITDSFKVFDHVHGPGVRSKSLGGSIDVS